MFALLAVCAIGATDPVVVSLRSQATVGSRVVTVADVADLSGGPASLHATIGRLDLGELSGSASLTVSRAQVGFRLRLADIPATLCRVQGAEEVQVAGRFRAITAEEVVAAARKTLLATLPLLADEVQIDLVQPVVAVLPKVADDETVVFKAEPNANQRPPGRMQMNVSIIVQGESRLALPVYFEVRPCVRVAVCRRRIDQGEALSEADVYLDLRPVDPRSAQTLDPRGVAGKKAKRSLMPGQVVQAADVEGAANPADTLLVKNQDAVRLQVRIGALKVIAAGQALQDGGKGQLIRVQNIDSKKVLLARVIERGLVEIE